MLTVVDGLLRTAVHRDPNGVECDACGRRVIFDRKEARHKLADLASEGWDIPKGFDDPAYCPEHAPAVIDGERLRKCPKCTSPDIRVDRTTYEGEPSYYIHCGDCEFEDDFGEAVTKPQAVCLWNAKY